MLNIYKFMLNMLTPLKTYTKAISEVASGCTVVSSHTTEIQSDTFFWDSESVFMHYGFSFIRTGSVFNELAKDGQRRKKN